MTANELEQLIEGQAESQNLDFKGPISWDVKSLAKDILAMSNVRDGGRIVIGVSEKGNEFVGEGLPEEMLKTFKIDVMKDQLSKYADPAVDIQVYFPKDSHGKCYVVIKVLPFRELPVISKSEIDGELKPCTIYYRNTDKRVQSAAVSNANDLRDIIESAAVKMMQRRREFGFVVPTAVPEILDQEIRDLPEDGLISTIKQKGYWEVRFMPLKPGNIETLSKCREIIEASKVSLNWTFPWIPHGNSEKDIMLPAGNCYQALSDLGSRKEFWRLYKSEQFLGYQSLPEDWYAGDRLVSSLADKHPEGETITLYGSIIHHITEIITFCGRLGERGLYSEGVKITMILHQTKGRSLRIDESHRYAFHWQKRTMASEIVLGGEYSILELIEDGVAISNKLILETLDAFGFNPHSDTIQIDQRKYLNGY